MGSQDQLLNTFCTALILIRILKGGNSTSHTHESLTLQDYFTWKVKQKAYENSLNLYK